MEHAAAHVSAKRRRIIQWVILSPVIITVGLGWKYPLLGFSVPAVMLAGMIGGIKNGRYVCGNLCPRGSFFDRILSYTSRQVPILNAFRNMPFRWVLFTGLMVLMTLRILADPGNIYHWGRVFWLMCAVTTGIGLVLGMFHHQRTWCAFCPMGTMQKALGGKNTYIAIDKDRCIECGRCEKACPFSLPVLEYRESGIMDNPDCLKCSECIAACPVDALSFTDKDRS